MEQSYTPMSKPNHDCNANLDISTAFHGSIESYTSSVPNDYLTPYSPDAIQSMKCQECVMNIDEGCRRLEPFCSQTSNCETNLDGLLHGQRLDSGFHSDVCVSPTSSISKLDARSSALYECIDPVDITSINKVSERKQTTFVRVKHPLSGGSSQTVNIARHDNKTNHGSAPCLAFMNTKINRCELEKFNDILGKSANELCTEAQRCKLHSLSKCQLRLFWCAVVFAITFTLFVSVFTVYIFFVLIPNMHHDLMVQKDDFVKLQSSFSRLYYKYHDAQDNLTMLTAVSLLDQREMQEIQQHVTDLDNSIETLNLDLLDLQSNMTQGFSNITSATDLEQRGGLDFNQCEYESRIYMQQFTDNGYTSWSPSIPELQDTMVMSATCETHNGTSHMVEIKKPHAKLAQFRCVCKGHSGSGMRKCVLNLVLCPRHAS